VCINNEGLGNKKKTIRILTSLRLGKIKTTEMTTRSNSMNNDQLRCKDENNSENMGGTETRACAPMDRLTDQSAYNFSYSSEMEV
jgi:hypothetical protein